MDIVDILKDPKSYRGQEIEVYGEAHVSPSMTLIYSLQGDPEPYGIYPGILIDGDRVWRELNSLETQIPIYCGSEIAYIVKMKAIGIASNTGYKFAALKLNLLYQLKIEDTVGNVVTIQMSERLNDIDIFLGRSLSNSEIKILRPYFEFQGNLIEFKKHLESHKVLRFISGVEESRVDQFTDLLKSIPIEYRVIESSEENDPFGLP